MSAITINDCIKFNAVLSIFMLWFKTPMLLTTDTPDDLAKIDREYKTLLKSLFLALQLDGQSTTISANTDVAALARSKNSLILITEGTLRCFWKGKLFLFVTEGELIGLEQGDFASDLSISTDFGIRAEIYSAPLFFEKLPRAPEAQLIYSKLLSLQSLRFLNALASSTRTETVLVPDVRTFPKDSVIIKEGDAAEEVYSLVEGRADVFVKGIKVGEVLQDEIFGMLAALTGSPRTATVTAAKDSLVLAVSREKFIELIETKPASVLKMIQDMSRLIVSLNTQVVSGELSKL